MTPNITMVSTGDLGVDDARDRCDRIKKMVSIVADDIAVLFEGRGWLALGYTSWAELCRVEFEGVQLAPGRRREVVADLRESGLSVRAIAAATGTTKSTIDRDLQVSRSGTPGMPEDDFMLVSSEATEDEFEAALTLARAADDLSRGGVARHLPGREKQVTGLDGKTYKRQSVGPHVPQPRTNIPAKVSAALVQIDTARRALEALTSAQLRSQNGEARSRWAANLSEQIDALHGVLRDLGGAA